MVTVLFSALKYVSSRYSNASMVSSEDAPATEIRPEVSLYSITVSPARRVDYAALLSSLAVKPTSISFAAGSMMSFSDSMEYPNFIS